MTDLDELEKLEKAATPGPWETGHYDGRCSIAGVVVHRCCEHVTYEDGEIGHDCSGLGPMRRDDGLLVAAVRNALPDLIKELRELRDFGRWAALRLTHEAERQVDNPNYHGVPSETVRNGIIEARRLGLLPEEK